MKRIEEKEEYRTKASLDMELCVHVDLDRKTQSADTEAPAKHGKDKAGSGLKHCWLSK